MLPLLLSLAFANPTQEEVDALREQVQDLTERVEALEAARVAAVPSDAPGCQDALVALRTRPMALEDKEEVLAELSEWRGQCPSSRYQSAITRTVEEWTVLGNTLPDDALIMLQGKPPKWKRGTHLVVFAEAWCPHCRREVPKLATESEQGGWIAEAELSLSLVTRLSRDTSQADATDWLRETGFTGPVVYDESNTVSTAANIRGVPAAALLVDGVIVWRGHPAQLNADVVQATLNRP